MVIIDPGVYVVAVSGGVDSIVLLHLLSEHAKTEQAKLLGGTHGHYYHPKRPIFQFVVAHFDHGIRPDSVEDRRFVQQLSDTYGLRFVYDRAELGANASEELAREARYRFLRKVAHGADAKAIITAHHQDDAIETAIFNMMRGTGRRGLTAISSGGDIYRPLLHVPKHDLVEYAKKHGLKWREDATNQDLSYARNRIRHQIVPRLTSLQRSELLNYVQNLREINAEIEREIQAFLHIQPANDMLDRFGFTQLPHSVAMEVMAQWLRQNGIQNYNRNTLERLVIGAKTMPAGRYIDIMSGRKMFIAYDYLALNV